MGHPTSARIRFAVSRELNVDRKERLTSVWRKKRKPDEEISCVEVSKCQSRKRLFEVWED